MKMCIYHISKATVSIGKTKKAQKSTISTMSTPINKRSDDRIMLLLRAIPMPIENPTSPFLYSFFTGLKKVRNSMGTEKKSKNAPLKALKYLRIEKGACPNQKARI